MTAVVMQPAELEAFVKAVGWLSIFGGMAGAAVMALVGYVYQWLTRRQRERDFREDLACIVDELEAQRAHANTHYARQEASHG